MPKIVVFCLFLLLFTQVQAQLSLTGFVVSKSGTTVVVKMDSVSVLPVKGDSVAISKDISGDKNPFGIMISSGWMSIGDAVFYSAANDRWTFKIYKETANIVVNGEKKEQFVPGKKVKIEWK